MGYQVWIIYGPDGCWPVGYADSEDMAKDIRALRAELYYTGPHNITEDQWYFLERRVQYKQEEADGESKVLGKAH